MEYRTYPLSFAEYCRFLSISTERLDEQQTIQLRLAWDDYNRYGGFPEVVLTQDRLLRDKLLQTYYHAMLFRDMVERHHIGNVGVLRYFIKRIMNNVGKPTSIHSIYNDKSLHVDFFTKSARKVGFLPCSTKKTSPTLAYSHYL